MSRTYRKRIESYEEYWKYCGWFYTLNKRDKAIYYTDKLGKNWFRDKLPKEYRNHINRKRRAKDRHALHVEITQDTVGEYSKWNCKDSEAWGYW